jgi:hypothetical protein
VVVVLGILIAFQVEEWREERQEAEEIRASLLRLAEEITANIALCEWQIPNAAGRTRTMEHVFLVLDRGTLPDKDREMFERGLLGASSLPPFEMLTTAVDELISTGLLKEVSDQELRRLITTIYQMQNSAEASYQSRRESIRDLSYALLDAYLKEIL